MGIIAVDTALMALIVVGLSSCIEGCLVPIFLKCPHDREEGRTAIAPMHGKIPALSTNAPALDAKGMFDAREAVNNIFRWNLLEAIALFPATALEARPSLTHFGLSCKGICLGVAHLWFHNSGIFCLRQLYRVKCPDSTIL